jgi:hypothetical protein
MHFSKSYSQILLSLPPELRQNAISYGQASPSVLRLSSLSDPTSDPPKLKKLINQAVQELTLLGFSPEVIRSLFMHGNNVLHAMGEKRSSDELMAVEVQSHAIIPPGHKLLYEVDNDLGHLVPRLRLIVDADTDMDTAVSKLHVVKTRILIQHVKPYVPILASLENPPADS